MHLRAALQAWRVLCAVSVRLKAQPIPRQQTKREGQHSTVLLRCISPTAEAQRPVCRHSAKSGGTSTAACPRGRRFQSYLNSASRSANEATKCCTKAGTLGSTKCRDLCKAHSSDGDPIAVPQRISRPADTSSLTSERGRSAAPPPARTAARCMTNDDSRSAKQRSRSSSMTVHTDSGFESTLTIAGSFSSLLSAGRGRPGAATSQRSSRKCSGRPGVPPAPDRPELRDRSLGL